METTESEIGDVLTIITKKIGNDPLFDGVRIYWDEVELTVNNASFPAIMLKPLAWAKGKFCDYERPLECRIFVDTEHRRQGLLQLWSYAEKLQKVMDEIALENDTFELLFKGGSEIGSLMYNNKDKESYKATSTLFSSAIILTYLLRY